MRNTSLAFRPAASPVTSIPDGWATCPRGRRRHLRRAASDRQSNGDGRPVPQAGGDLDVGADSVAPLDNVRQSVAEQRRRGAGVEALPIVDHLQDDLAVLAPQTDPD